jgi:hypothetical protein
MRKLTLDPEALRVQSFATAGSRAFPYGTVHGRQKPEPTDGLFPGCDLLDSEEMCRTRVACPERTRPPECPNATDGPPCPEFVRTREENPKETESCPPPEMPPVCPGPFSMVSCTV